MACAYCWETLAGIDLHKPAPLIMCRSNGSSREHRQRQASSQFASGFYTWLAIWGSPPAQKSSAYCGKAWINRTDWTLDLWIILQSTAQEVIPLHPVLIFYEEQPGHHQRTLTLHSYYHRENLWLWALGIIANLLTSEILILAVASFCRQLRPSGNANPSPLFNSFPVN